MKAVKEINFLSHIFQKTVFHRERTVFWIWMSSGLIYAIVKLLIGKYNNYKIFENVFPHVRHYKIFCVNGKYGIQV